MLASEHFASSSKAIRDLIQNEQGSMPITGLSNDLPILRRWNVRSAAHGFRYHGADIPFFFQNIFNISGTLQGAPFPAIPRTVDGIGWRHVFRSRKEGTNTVPEDCFSTNGNCVQRCDVERTPHRTRLQSSRVHPPHRQRHSDGSRARRSEQDFVEIPWCQLRQFPGQLDRRNVGIASGTKRQNIHLRLNGLNNLAVAKAYLVDGVAVEIHVAPTLKIFDIDTVTTREYVQARSG